MEFNGQEQEMKRFQSARHPDEVRHAAESEARNMRRRFEQAKAEDHAAAIREHTAREAARSLGVDFDAFMREEQ